MKKKKKSQMVLKVSTCHKCPFESKQPITDRFTELQWSWNFSRSPDRGMNKRHKFIIVHQRCKNGHYRLHGASTHLTLSRNIMIKPVMFEICIQHNNAITKEHICSIQKTRFNIFIPNHRAETKPSLIFISIEKKN